MTWQLLATPKNKRKLYQLVDLVGFNTPIDQFETFDFKLKEITKFDELNQVTIDRFL